MINPAFGLYQAVPYSLLKLCGKVPAKTWTRLDAELDAAISQSLIPLCLRGEVVPAIERMVREPIGYAVIEKRAA